MACRDVHYLVSMCENTFMFYMRSKRRAGRCARVTEPETAEHRAWRGVPRLSAVALDVRYKFCHRFEHTSFDPASEKKWGEEGQDGTLDEHRNDCIR